MKATTFLSLTSLASAALAWPWDNLIARNVAPRRKSSLLINPDPQPDLPTVQAVAATLPTDDIQGDILIGMKKKRELFWFFKIEDAAAFKTSLHNDIVPLVTNTDSLLQVSTQPVTAVNIAFSHPGLVTLGHSDDMVDSDFQNGQFSDAPARFHDRADDWVPAFKSGDIHGVILLASDTQSNIDTQLAALKTSLGTSASEVYSLQGAARPGAHQGHEHFDYMDGISQPHVDGFGTALPGQKTIQPGQVLLGEDGDFAAAGRPTWAKDGSFLAFRQLKQFVPEFNKFLIDNPTIVGSMTPEEGSAFTGARMVGRWKSGAPIALAPLADDPTLAADPSQNNKFDFSEQDDFVRCPFSAHIRKTNPRSDLGNSPFNNIIRAGIPYGPEVSDDEAAANATSTDASLERGLAFVSYQSQISGGFAFIQQNWVNNDNFFQSGTGLDPIIGTNGGSTFDIAGVDPNNPSQKLTIIQDFVLSRGGEYFFSPSISALRDVLSV
ncbi:fungal peroxidase [Flagelloscypha sp. PMI_526]|nr:fungal peroxidase [Flagelloscypha sp. PMI_526]